MPKVTFVNEDRTVDVAAGRKVSDVAAELGIAVCREQFGGTTFLGNYTIWVKGPDGCVSAPDFWEKLQGVRGWRRLANRTKILADVQIFTQPGIRDRLRSPRPITPPPTPRTDPDAARLGVSDAGSAAFPYGNPLAVGKGEREPVARSTGKKVAAKGAAAASGVPSASEEEESE
jgi:hypothetical protein